MSLISRWPVLKSRLEKHPCGCPITFLHVL